MAKKKICLVVSTPLIVHFFLRRHLRNVAERFEATLVTGSPDEALHREYGASVRIVGLPIERDIAPLRDVAALWGLTRELYRGRYDLVHTITPKAGLLGILAGWLARMPVRLHTFQGEVWLTRRGMLRALLKTLDRFVARLATHLLVVSPSERDFLERERIIPPGKARVIGKGSVTGVDLERFKADPAARRAVRESLGIAPDAIVFLFVGRLDRDKGVMDLVHAFARLAEARRDIALVFVGPDEDRLEPVAREALGPHAASVRFVGYTATPERYFAAADVLSLPSYREGFGNVIIEAAACGIPAAASRIYGITDALVEGETGLLHGPGDVAELAAVLERLAEDAALRARLGRQAKARVEREFAQERVCGELLAYYETLLSEQ